MGLDQERIVEKDSIIDDIICSICMDIVESPLQCQSQHSFCEECITKWIKDGNGSCPVDRTELNKDDLQPPRILHQVLNKFTVRCENFEDGCRLMAKFEDISQLVEHKHKSCLVTHSNFSSKIESLNNKVEELERDISANRELLLKKEKENDQLLEKLNSTKNVGISNDINLKNKVEHPRPSITAKTKLQRASSVPTYLHTFYENPSPLVSPIALVIF